ncbi:uncharacterized protein LOC126734943 [Anthonomus grandis grandis]|uniref:uncharacterized protein LOC126734943 n=1 Tax=Anthonomus grandis grandis TaxID=2921223 RepID=UPI00216524F1|nr:uncharacterized protein LOC126734943 [Anthonomus grandis grandis]
MKCLRQHYLKVHTEKTFKCISCLKCFPSRSILIDHQKFCQTHFQCLECNASYSCYFTLKTHSRRKKHRILKKQDYKPLNLTKDMTFQGIDTVEKKSQSIIQILSESSQTEFRPIRITQHTQTGCRNIVITSETQTERPILTNVDDNLRNVTTQTDLVESKETSCNTSFDIREFEATFREHIEKSSFGTQTQHLKNDIFVANHGSITTDTSDLLSDSLSNFDTNFFNCNTETQTDLIFDNEMLMSDYYSNMHTQTCDEILQDLNGFNDIQTQTGLQDSFRSVESQTLMSTSDKLCPNILKDIVHSETQTDVEFRQMLEIINS